MILIHKSCIRPKDDLHASFYANYIASSYSRFTRNKGIDAYLCLIDDMHNRDGTFDIVRCKDDLERVVDLNFSKKSSLGIRTEDISCLGFQIK